MRKNITELPKRVLIILARLMYFETTSYYELDDYTIKHSVSASGFEPETAEEVTFLYELYKLNYDNLKNKTLNENNIVLPQRKKIKILAYQYVNEQKKYLFEEEVFSYSTDFNINEDSFMTNDKNEDYIGDTIWDDIKSEEVLNSELDEMGVYKIEEVKENKEN
jgi:hypothetical protein